MVGRNQIEAHRRFSRAANDVQYPPIEKVKAHGTKLETPGTSFRFWTTIEDRQWQYRTRFHIILPIHPPWPPLPLYFR
jgi:hypothetical protein